MDTCFVGGGEDDVGSLRAGEDLLLDGRGDVVLIGVGAMMGGGGEGGRIRWESREVVCF